MAGSSPVRRSHNPAPSSPLSDILYGDRNSEARHKQLLEAARQEHERVRRLALQTLEEHQKSLEDQQREQERRRILEQERKEQERIRQEQELAAERRKLQALQAHKVEIPPEPRPIPQPPKAPPISTSAAPSAKPTPAAAANPFGQATAGHSARQQQSAAPPTQGRALPPQTGLPQQNAPPSNGAGAFGAAAASRPFPPPQMPSASDSRQVRPKTQVNGSTPSATPRVSQSGPDRYEDVHRNLKDLRRSMLDQAKTNAALKGRMGDMRREIRKCVGQLTHGVAAGNRTQVNTTDPGSPRPFRKILVCFFSLICFTVSMYSRFQNARVCFLSVRTRHSTTANRCHSCLPSLGF